MRWKFIIPIIIMLVIFTAVIPSEIIIENDTQSTPSETLSISCPQWKVTDYWEYSIKTEHFPDTEAFMACYDIIDDNYMIGMDVREQALIHSLFNVNPMLGRITKNNLAVYENGVPKTMYNFPLTYNKIWEFNMFNRNLNVKAFFNPKISTTQGLLPGFEIIATNDAGFLLEYNYIPEIKWFTHFKVTDEQGIVKYDLELLDYGSDFHGTLYFMRGKDLYDMTYESIGKDDITTVLDTLEVTGHPKYGDFDFLAINIAVDLEGNGWTKVIVQNPNNEIVYSRDILADKHEFTFTELPNKNGNWQIRYSLFTKSTAKVIIAGVLEYSVTV